MEDEKENINKIKEANVGLIYYLNKDKKEEGNLKFIYKREIKMISYNDITESFYTFISNKNGKVREDSDLYFSELNKNDLIYKSIRYFDGYGWILLNEDDIIILDENLNLNNLKIMIHSDIISQKDTDSNSETIKPVEKAETYTVSSAQRRIYFANEIAWWLNVGVQLFLFI